MSKGQDSKKSVKKKPLLTAKEKKAAKKSKKTAAVNLQLLFEISYKMLFISPERDLLIVS